MAHYWSKCFTNKEFVRMIHVTKDMCAQNEINGVCKIEFHIDATRINSANVWHLRWIPSPSLCKLQISNPYISTIIVKCHFTHNMQSPFEFLPFFWQLFAHRCNLVSSLSTQRQVAINEPYIRYRSTPALYSRIVDQNGSSGAAEAAK